MSATTLTLTPQLHRYLVETGVREPPILAELRQATSALPEAGMQISPEQGALLANLVRLSGARRLIEVGTFGGYSALWMALALPDDGELLTCDTNIEWTNLAQRFWRRAGVESRIDLRIGPALDTLDGLLAAGEASSFDMVFIDADKPAYRDYHERSLTLLRPAGVIAIDNVLWGGTVLEPTPSDPNAAALRAFNADLAADDRVEISMLPIGDGLTLAVKC